MPDLITQGFGLGMVLYVFAWGMTFPFRLFRKLLGM